MRGKIGVLVIVGLCLAAAVSSYLARANAAREQDNGPKATPITAQQVPLNQENPAITQVGELHYVAGWALTSESDDFGGWSGMVVSEGGTSLVAINDKGDWLKARLSLNGQAPITDAVMLPFEAGARAADKEDYDAESLVQTETGLLVGLEQEHRILAVDAVGGENRPIAANALIDFSALSSNGGLEALTQLPSGKLLMFAERGLDQQKTLAAWIAGEKTVKKLRFAPPENYSPTDAAALPNGDVLLLMRHYSAFDGVSAKVLHITAAEIAAGTVLKGRELAHLSPPYAVDNMEALDIQVQADGTVRLFMMSDDNFSVRQQTLLLVFDWQP